MEENISPPLLDARITDIRFSVATDDEICVSSISEGSINHPSQLTNPFLGLPLESGKCESCGTAEPGKCEGHFGYIQLPIPVYHPSHVTELKRLLNLVCLKCLRLKRGKNIGTDKSSKAPCLYCQEIPLILINEDKTSDGVVLLDLKLPGRSQYHDGFWNFLDKYGYRYGDGKRRILLPCEVLEILKRIPVDTRKKLSSKGYFPQDGYILQKVPVPPNCLSIPDISDGVSIMSSDISVSMLRKVLKQADIIKCSRSGRPNFESHKVEVNDLQSAVAQYFRARGTAKDTRDVKMRAGTSKEAEVSATKAWLEKMRTFFISKGSGYCSRGVITGDAYKKVNEIGLPLEVAQKITFEEKVTECNKDHLQELVDKKLCLTYKDGASMYSLREGSMGHTLLKVGQVVHRRIMDGDILFINRPPSTHKHSLQALSVYVHEDNTVKINPLICGPLDADFDGDCVHLFYPQSLAARAEVVELFSVEKQLLSSHSGSLNLQLKNDSLLSLKIMFKRFFLDKVTAQQLAMFITTNLPPPALFKANCVGSQWTALQILQTALPDHFDCLGERYFISDGEILKIDFNKDILQSMFNEIISSVLIQMDSKEALSVFNSLQPLLMENIFLEGYSVCLKDFYISKSVLENLPRNIQEVSPLLCQLRSTYNELVELQVANHLRSVKAPVVSFILKASGLGNLIDSKSESSINKVAEQMGFLGLQLADRGKFYSRNLVEDMTSLFLRKYAVTGVEHPSEAFGLIKGCFFHGLNPYEDLVHSISSREVLVRSSRGLTEPGTLFKNLMTILRDVVICYDGTVRNVCSNTIIQFQYAVEAGMNPHRFYPSGEPVGALAATAISNPAYKAVLDSSSSSNASWDLMKEILVCKINFINDTNDRRVILYLNDCCCVKKHCKENAAFLVQKQLKKVSLKDISVNFLIEYQNSQTSQEISGTNTSLVGHIHLDKHRLKDLDRSMHEVLLKCQETVSFLRRKKRNKLVDYLKNIFLTVSECCCFEQSYDSEWSHIPCLQFSWRLDAGGPSIETTSQIMTNMICPILLDTIIKGDHRVYAANIIWISPDSNTWVKNHSSAPHGELALEIILEKQVVKQHGDAWRLALDACLPMIHLIDTRRSIPYAIRQVQEILGISCAFDQAVQRLSTSIRMVNKGVLKEHLVLAVNSMTCTGSLIGFNKGGYKALFRSLNVQIPFTEATLFTPRKCFERAAEKCHTDTLSGIVASCSWGKHVAVGSGTHFEILWNKNEVQSDQSGVVDIYNFLQLVRTSRGQSNTSCLGEDYDVEFESGVAEPFSPVQDFDKPTFDDADLQCDFENNQTSVDWGAVTAKPFEGDQADGWNTKAPQNISSKTAVDSWGKQSEESDAWGATERGSVGGWNTSVSKKLPTVESSDAWGKQAKESEANGWGAVTTGWGTADSQKVHSKEPADASGEQAKESNTNGWGANASGKPIEESGTAAWGTTATSWKGKESQKSNSKEPADAWGKSMEDSGTAAWGASTASWEGKGSQKSNSEEPVGAWGKSTGTTSLGATTTSWKGKESQNSDSKAPADTWGNQMKKSDVNTWGATTDSQKSNSKEPAGAWGKSMEDSGTAAWGATATSWKGKESQKSSSEEPVDAWGKSTGTTSWGATPTSWKGKESQKVDSKEPADTWGNQKKKSNENTWGAATDSQNLHSKEPLDAWETQKKESDTNAWGAVADKSSEGVSVAGWNTLGSPVLPSMDPVDSWGKQTKQPVASPWDNSSSKKPSESLESAGWNANESHTQASQKKNSDGWGNKNEVQWGQSEKSSVDSPRVGGWNNLESQATSADDPCDSTWGKKVEETKSSSWSNSKQANQPTSSWGSPSFKDWSKNGQAPNEKEGEAPHSSWGKNNDETKSSSGWTRNGQSQDDQERNLPWGRGKKQSGGRGWGSSNSGDWKQRGRPGNTPGKFDERNPRGSFPPGRSRLDQYTPEEQQILSELDPIIQSLKRIMHQSGYDDGVPLSAEDQTYILDNVFKYHPDKASKTGLGIDHVMISKHSSFQETRCLYIVSTDGSKEDFSYRKCMENFVKEKYPELAASFVGKYFKKPRGRGGNEQEQTPASQPQTPASQPQTPASQPPPSEQEQEPTQS